MLVLEQENFANISNCKQDDYDGANSSHVLKYMELFTVTVMLKYEIIEDEVDCDIMDDDLKLSIIN